MEKVKMKNLPFIYPAPAVLAGAIVDGKPNYVTLGNCGIMSINPPVIYISSQETHYTNKGIQETQVFSVNITSTDLMSKLDYCGIVSGNEADKSALFETYYGSNKDAPLISECPINLVCEVIKTVDVFDMNVFIGQVTEVYANQKCLTNGFPDTQKLNPLLYCIDNGYWTIGKQIGEGYSEGKVHLN